MIVLSGMEITTDTAYECRPHPKGGAPVKTRKRLLALLLALLLLFSLLPVYAAADPDDP